MGGTRVLPASMVREGRARTACPGYLLLTMFLFGSGRFIMVFWIALVALTKTPERVGWPGDTNKNSPLFLCSLRLVAARQARPPSESLGRQRRPRRLPRLLGRTEWILMR